MHIHQPYKQLNIGAYILFLAAVFLMFAVVFNTMLQASAGRLVFFMMQFIITLGCGTLLFLFSVDKIGNLHAQTDVLEEEKMTDEGENQLSEIKEDIVEEKLFDVQSLLPLEMPSTEAYCDALLRNMAREFNFVQALLYIKKTEKKDTYTCKAQYACFSDSKPSDFMIGETLPGQAAKNKIIVSVSNIPENYMPVVSGLGKGVPRQLVFVPCLYYDEVIAIIEYATFQTFNGIMENNLLQLSEKVAENIINLNKEI